VYRIIAYFPAWGVNNHYFVTDIPAHLLTHLNYAFFHVSEDGRCVLGDEYADTQYMYPGDSPDEPVRGNFKQLQLLKQAYPHLKTLLSIGGWTDSANFSDAALTVASRERFARSCVEMMQQYGFDGIDIDWEYPVHGGLTPERARPEDRENFTALLAELRAQLDALGGHYLLTFAAPAPPQIYAHLELDQIGKYLDWINLMTYDFHTIWDTHSNFHAPLYASSTDPAPDDVMRLHYNADAAVRGFLAAGIPAAKIVLGVPFYGRGWSGVPDVNHGLYQPVGGLPEGTQEGFVGYRDLKARYMPTYTRYWQDEVKAPWLYNADTQIMFGYEDADSLRHKAAYVKAHHLGGIMFWEISLDDDDHTLLKTIYEQLQEKG